MSKQFRSPRKVPSQGRSKEMVSMIVEAAASVFSSAGFELATTNHIAAKAGVSIGSFYQYFPNKSALLFAVWERHLAGMLTNIATACNEGCDLPWPSAFRHTVVAAIDHCFLDQGLFAVFHTELPTDLVMPPVLGLSDTLAAAKQLHDDSLRKLLSVHRDRITVNVDDAVRMIPNIGAGFIPARFLEKSRETSSLKMTEELTAIMLGYLTSPGAPGERKAPTSAETSDKTEAIAGFLQLSSTAT